MMIMSFCSYRFLIFWISRCSSFVSWSTTIITTLLIVRMYFCNMNSFSSRSFSFSSYTRRFRSWNFISCKLLS